MSLGALVGSMFHKDAHTDPGGLYAPDGQLRHVYEMASAEIGGGDPIAYIESLLSSAPSASNPFPCQEEHDLYHGQNPDPTDSFRDYMIDALRDEVGGDSWENWEAFITEEYIKCLEGAVAPYYDEFGG